LSKKSERLYDLVKGRKVGGTRLDPLEEELRAEDEELVREAKRLRLEELIAKRKKRLMELEGSNQPKLEGLDVSPAMARELAKLPDEERKRVIETYVALKSAERMGGAGGALLPLLIGYARANPGASQNNMVEFAKIMADQLKAGIDLAKTSQPTQPPTAQWNPVELVKTFADLIKDNVQRPMEELVKKVQPSPSPFEREG